MQLNFEIHGLIYRGPEVQNSGLEQELPSSYMSLLNSINGFVAWNGGLHIRGLCEEPSWHSLRQAWEGHEAFHFLYENVRASDLPFAQDAFGDQFLIRDNQVMHLSAETGDLELKADSLKIFLENVSNDPLEYLLLQPLQQFLKEGNTFEPGRLIMAYPPFCTKESANGVSLKTIPAEELILFHADFAKQIPGDGQSIQVIVED